MKMVLHINIEKLSSDNLKDYYVLSDFNYTFAVKKGISESDVAKIATHHIRVILKRAGNEGI